MSHFKTFRYPRWQLIQQSAGYLPWFLSGIIILTAPYGHFRWFGIVPLVWCATRWLFVLQPKWDYVIRTDEKRLCIGSEVYQWNQLEHLQMERNKNRRSIHLTGLEGKIDLVIKDDLPGFRQLTQECLFYMSQPDDQPTQEEPFRSLHHGESIEKQIIFGGKQFKTPRKH